jgi:hypothetical protein
MKQELKSGIVEFDLLVEQFENGEINFVELTSALWNKGYDEGKKQAYSQTLVSGSVCDCMKNLYTEGIFVKCSKCGTTINIQEQTVH